MKRLVWLIPIALLASLSWFSSVQVNATTDAALTLSAGQKEKILSNNCNLSVTVNTPTLVKVKCSGVAAADSGVVRIEQPTAAISLNAGQRLSIKANQCNLIVAKHIVSVVKIVCDVFPTATSTVTTTNTPLITNTPTRSPTASTTPTSTDTPTPTDTPTSTNTPTNTTKPSATPTSTNTPTITLTPTSSLTPTPQTVTVDVGNGGLNFSPQQQQIRVGDTVHWVWFSSNHTVNSGTIASPDDLFCSPTNMNCSSKTNDISNSGFTYDHTFNSPGTFPYFCKIHGPSMSGSIVVNP